MQDVSCVGQCSMTVALPILSACGHETCILPTAVLSTHTAFPKPSITDLSKSLMPICDHWKKENISFDAIYTGYLGSIEEIHLAEEIFATFKNEGCQIVVDPAMADTGKLYPGFDEAYVSAMTQLCAAGDVILPNITEACFMTGHPYKEEYDEAYVQELVKKLHDLGAKTVVLTGVGYTPDHTGVLISSTEKTAYYCHTKLEKSYHGTGDIFASAFVGAWMQGKSLEQSVKIAADFVVSSIKQTIPDPAHWYGVKFEAVMGQLVKALTE